MRISFTGRELDTMAVLWERGSGTVAEVRRRLSDDLAYTTVLTILRTLERKRYVRHEEEGRAHRYFPLIERQAAGKSEVWWLVARFPGGSPELIITEMAVERDQDGTQVKRRRMLLDGPGSRSPAPGRGRS